MVKRFAFAMAVLCVAQTVYATDSTVVGRYITISNKPTQAQRDLLSQIIQVRFPVAVQTIGEALNYLLKFSGYSLIETSRRSSELNNTLTKSLPVIDRDFGPMALRDALSTLMGPAFSLVQDPLNRTIDFKLKPQFIHRIKRGV